MDASYDDEGGLTSITVDLGILNDASTIAKTATANVTLGSLASTIIGGVANRTWTVTFEVVFNGAPTQTGGVLTQAVQNLIKGQSSEDTAAGGKEAADEAAADALAALDGEIGAAKDGSGSLSTSLNSKVAGSPTEGGDGGANPMVAIPVVLVAAAVVAGILVAYKRRKRGGLECVDLSVGDRSLPSAAWP